MAKKASTKAVKVESTDISVEEKKKALSVLMKTQTGKDFEFEDKMVAFVSVIRIDVSEYTAKYRPMPKTNM